ncbi:MAG TPA: HAD family hydrolase [Alphaproteobacteria bacterium]|nr:HAD family hydrolase [Alphaproteobacteria bacterium]
MRIPNLVAAVAAVVALTASAALADPLPSWKQTETKTAIVAFVEGVTQPDGTDYVDPARRIAVFDNDGTLWAEQPAYFQLLFAVDRVAAMAKEDPGIAKTPALKAAAAQDFPALLETGMEGLLEVVAAAHSGMDVAGFRKQVALWLEEARHAKTGMRYDEMVYQPMLELLSYLRDKDFKTYIVSGGGVHFMRVFAEETYGIPPEQVIGTTGETSYQIVAGQPTIMKEPGIAFLDDKEGKPIAIDRAIGRRPTFAAGNSDGDLQMLQWTTAGDGPRFALLVHHTDAEREWAYDRTSHIGKLDKALDEANAKGWTVVDMKTDWKVVFPSEP